MTMNKKSAPVLSKDVVTKLEQLETMSAKIRYLHSRGMSRGDISRTLNIRYQWVRNVLITPIKSK